MHLGSQVTITTDASPWGMGGILEVNGKIQEFFAEDLEPDVACILKIPVGKASGQQVAEAFAMLIALRLWQKTLRSVRSFLHVKSDSRSALSLILTMKSSGYGNNLIAREVALDIAQACYVPQVVAHVPGVSNVSADTLSRLSQPGKQYRIPDHLAKVHRAHLPHPHKQIFRTLDAIPRCIVP